MSREQWQKPAAASTSVAPTARANTSVKAQSSTARRTASETNRRVEIPGSIAAKAIYEVPLESSPVFVKLKRKKWEDTNGNVASHQYRVAMAASELLTRLDASRLKVHTRTAFGRVYALDCMKVMAKMPDESLDLCVTSPPYERQPKYGNGERYERDWFEGFFMEVAAEVQRVLKPTGQFVLNYRSRRDGAERGTLQYELVFWLREQGWLFAEDHIWIKPSPPPGRYKRALKDAVEYCFRFAKSDLYELYPEQCLAPARWDVRDRERRKKLAHNHERVNAPSGHGRSRVQAGRDWVAPSNAIVTEPEFSPNPSKHPARFPPALPEFFIKLCTKPGGSVFDPFAGTCTAGVVAEALDRQWVMAELDGSYCDVVPDRLADLATRMKRMDPLQPEVPDELRAVPLPFALPAPRQLAS